MDEKKLLEDSDTAKVEKPVLIPLAEDVEARLTIRKPLVPAPEKFSMGDDFHIWESQVRRYLRFVPVYERCDMVLSLLSREAYGKIMDCDIPDNVDELLQLLRVYISESLPCVEYRCQFHERRQILGESLLDFIANLRRLARLAFPSDNVEVREKKVLERFL